MVFSRQPVSRLLLAATRWLMRAFVVQVCVTFLLAFAIGFQKGFVARSGHGQPWVVPGWVMILVATATFQLTLLFIAWRRGKVAGDGDVRRGLGMTPLRRPCLLAGLSLAIVPAVICWAAIMLRLAVPVTSGLAPVLAAAREQALMPEIALLVVAGLVAPAAEECFFRGWLWTGLRRHLDPLAVMSITSTLWLSLHMLDNPFRPLYLFPSAVFFGIARHCCDSACASLALHLVNNLLSLGAG